MSICVYFRYLRLNKLQALTLLREIPGAEYEESGKGFYLARVPLEAENIDAINMYFVRQQIAINESDILIVASEINKGEVVTAPSVVNHMLKHINCPVSFAIAAETS